MTIRITKSNISGFTGDSEMLPVEPEQSQFFIPSAVEGVDNFSIDIIVEGVYPDVANPEVFTYQYATDVRSSFDWASIGVSFTKPTPYTIRLTGPATGIFVNQFYKFKMLDYSEQVLPADTQSTFLGLIQYQMPQPTFTMKTFAFEADLPADLLLPGPGTTEQFNMFQWYFWRYQSAVANIADITSRGLK